ncbi:MAG: hypothetical protein C0467_00630 [Planctomycetaceae bacterium]|nr:hypothetical protein [Planctomycetaceae bacterium]
MNEQPIPYRVSYSQRVREELVALVNRVGPFRVQLLAALREIDHRLRIYPQFGQPLFKLMIEPVEVWIGVVAPLVVEYVLDEETRTVNVLKPFRVLPGFGL